MVHNLSNCDSDQTNQSKCENRLGVSGTQGYRAWEGLLHPPPPLLPSGSQSASLWGWWEDSVAWHESTGYTMSLGYTMLKMPFLSGSHTNTLETSSSHGTNKINCDLHFSRCSSAPPQTLNPRPKAYSGKLSVMFARGALRKRIHRWGRLNHDVQDEARIYDW